MTRYDIIGDIHGCGKQLRALLVELGYEPDGSGVYRHPDRTAGPNYVPHTSDVVAPTPSD